MNPYLLAFVLLLNIAGGIAIDIILGWKFFRKTYMEVLEMRMDEIVNEVNRII